MTTTPTTIRGAKTFVDEVSAQPGGEKINECIQCGVCSGSCTTVEWWEYPPRKIIAMIRAGKIKALAVLSSSPDPILPGTPNLKELGHEEIPCIILCNKMDLKRQISDKQITDLAAKLGFPVYFTSAKSGENVRAAFEQIATLCLQKGGI